MLSFQRVVFVNLVILLHLQKTWVKCSESGEKSRDEIQLDSFDSEISTDFSEPRIFTFSLFPFPLSASFLKNEGGFEERS